MARRNNQVVLTAAVLLVVLLVVGSLVLTAQGVARSQGGGIEAGIHGQGTATQIRCSRSMWSLWIGWRCQADQVDWDSKARLPRRIEAQQAPYEVLATSDLTGQEARVSSHLPMDWETASRQPVEILVADGHPVGSQRWWTAQAFAPFALVGAGMIVIVGVLRLRPGRRSRRRRSPVRRTQIGRAHV